MNKLVLVWEEKSGGRHLIIVPLKNVTREVYNKFTSMYGVPKGRTMN